jgi:hypothetical protein
MSRRHSLAAAFAFVATVLAASLFFACSQAPTPVPLRTFERAQRMDVVCLRVFADDGSAIVPEGLTQENCSPVPSDVNGGGLQNQLFALVTQTTRGELAVVDLSAGFIVDQNRVVPGTNFLPVGANPTDVATAPDGRMAFVASAEANKAAIYGISTRRILGDIKDRPRDPDGPVTLSSWPVCALPQNPGALAVVPRRSSASSDPDAGVDAGGSGQTLETTYELVAVLPGDRRSSAKIVTIDPKPFLRGASLAPPDGPVLAPGSLAPCPITSAVELAGEEALPDTFRAGPRWPDGVPYVDGGVDLDCKGPPRPSPCGLVPCKCLGLDAGGAGGSIDAGGGDPDGGAATDAGACAAGDPDAGDIALDLGPVEPPRLVAVARDDQTLFVADEGVPLIHVVDLSSPGQPRELPPFLATSIVDPSRVVSIRDLAVSPATRDYKRFLYAVDRKDGSLLVYDVTDVATAARTPMTRPHPELNPFQPPDRLVFAAPVVAVTFARHDFPLARIGAAREVNAKSGVLCNPNPNIATPPEGQRAGDFGFYYRADRGEPDVALGPARLRGVFAMVTLSDGQIVTIDVDDWDAPCRRPTDLRGRSIDVDGGAPLTVPVSDLAVVPPEPAPGDLDAYHAPVAPPESVTNEAFFPVSAPHRLRSAAYLRDDPRTGRHVPYVSAAPVVEKLGTPLPLIGDKSEETPRIHPTAVERGVLAGANDNGVRFSFEVPDVHLDQDWTVTYEGALLGLDGVSGTLETQDGDQSIILRQPQAQFCSKGVEDWSASGDRANQIIGELASVGRPPYPERIDRRLVDYVQVIDDILPAEDPYWGLADERACWGDIAPASRHEVCVNAYGASAQGVEVGGERDFPILEAYDDNLVLGRFATLPPNQTREIVYKDPSNAGHLRLLRCCFHHQVKFKVRTGSQWLASGSLVGVLNHMTRGEGGRCVASCDPKDALLNARAPALPFGPGALDPPVRDSALALRNPALAFFVQNGSRAGVDLLPERDTVWRFTTRGQFLPLVIDLAAQTFAVNPQSMRFVETLGQVAVVDASSQGLVLINLASIQLARAPYF